MIHEYTTEYSYLFHKGDLMKLRYGERDGGWMLVKVISVRPGSFRGKTLGFWGTLWYLFLTPFPPRIHETEIV